MRSISALLLCLSLSAGSAHAQTLHIYHIDVEQAAATLFVAPGGKTLLVDSGKNGMGTRLKAAMDQAGATKVDYFVCTHYHEDHYGGIDDLFDSGVQIKDTYDRGDKECCLSATKKNEAAFKGYQGSVGDDAIHIRPGDTIPLDPAMTVTCLSSGGLVIGESGQDTGEDENDMSVSLLITLGSFRYFIGGDMHAKTEQKIADRDLAKGVVMYEANHHGSHTSSSSDFMNDLAPQVIVISNGNRVDLQWIPSASGGPASGYYIYRSEYGGMVNCGTGHSLLGTASNATFVDSTARIDGVPLFYRVRAFNAAGGSDVSNEASVSLSVPVTVGGGYMYLDTNGNGIHDSGDILNETGSTLVDVWLSTDRNKDGSYATCSDGSGAPNELNGYTIVLRAIGGTVAWSGFTNRVAGFGTAFPVYSDSVYYANGRGGVEMQPAGTYRLASITVTPQKGTPYLVIDQVAVPAPNRKTLFGSSCSGLDGNNTLRLGQDWFDTDGAGSLETWVQGGIRVYSGSGARNVPVIASDGAGGAIIAWQDTRGGDFTHQNIYAQRIDAVGNRFWRSDGVLICSHPAHQGPPRIVSDGAGGAIIAWEDSRGQFDEPDIYAQRVNSLGATLWQADGVPICAASRYQTFSTQGKGHGMAADGQGGAVVVWEDSRNTYPQFGDIYAQKVSGSGSVQWGANGIPASSIFDPTFDFGPVVVSDGGGGAVIAWMRSAAASDIYAQRITADGTTEWSDGLLICNAAGSQNDIQAIADKGGGVIIAWADARASASAPDVYAQRISVGTGATLWQTNGVFVDPWITHDPALAPDRFGGAILAYRDGATSIIRTQNLSAASGAKLWGPIDGELGPGDHPILVADGLGGATCISCGGSTARAQKIDQATGNEAWASDIGPCPRRAVSDGVGGVLVTWAGSDTIYAARVGQGGGTYATDVPTSPPSVSSTSLGQIYPNPFNPVVTIRFSIATRGRACIRVYDTLGRLVRTLLDADVEVGAQMTHWDGSNEKGQRVASGVYFCRLEAAGSKSTRRMVLMK